LSDHATWHPFAGGVPEEDTLSSCEPLLFGEIELSAIPSSQPIECADFSENSHAIGGRKF
jgi:hypothetical protein